MRKMSLACALLIGLVLVLCFCVSGQNDGAVSPSASAGEAPAELSGQAAPEASVVKSDLNFCGVAFGSSRNETLADESLKITKSYANAVETEPISAYGYIMQPTFWFNEAGLLFSGSYETKSEDYVTGAKTLMEELAAEYGTPVEETWYDKNNNAAFFSTDAEAEAAVDSGSVFYCVTYNSPDGLMVELYVQAAESGGYEYYIYFTDSDYMDLG